MQHFTLKGLVALCASAALATASPAHHSHASAQDIITKLDLIPSTEKGYFVETFRDEKHLPCAANRSASTAIYYLLEGKPNASPDPKLNTPDHNATNDRYSLWHTVDQAEVWHFYAGSPLTLYTSDDSGSNMTATLMGSDVLGGQTPQAVVPQGKWQRARSWGAWTLVGTTVAPSFEVSGSVVKPEGWQPGDD